jgi:hypothetical protein
MLSINLNYYAKLKEIQPIFISVSCDRSNNSPQAQKKNLAAPIVETN